MRARLLKRRRWLLAPATILLVYVGYCWGLWGRSNLVLRYLFQCACPGISEEARFPKQVDVIIPACQNVAIDGMSPEGRRLHLVERFDFPGPKYLLDLEKGERLEPPVQEEDNYSLLTDKLLLVSPRGEERYLLNLETGAQESIAWLFWGNTPTLENGRTLDPAAVLSLLRDAREVFLWDGLIVMLDVSSKNYMVRGGEVTDYSVGGGESEKAKRFLDENDVPYVISYQPYPSEGLLSHTGAFVARQDGIYLAETGEKIVDAPDYGFAQPSGWVYDDRGVILRPSGNYVINTVVPLVGFLTDDMVRYQRFWVPDPVLLLKVPEAYLPPLDQTPVP